MEINNNPVFNPAAVVQATGRQAGGQNPEQVNDEKNSGRVISQATLMSFANGQPRLSEESAQAISNGALPPELVIPEPKQVEELQQAIDQTVQLQTQTEQVDDGVIVQLSNVAQQITQQFTQPQLQIAALNSTYSAPTRSSDTATAAFSNTVDFTT